MKVAALLLLCPLFGLAQVDVKGSLGYAGFEDEDKHVHLGGAVRHYFTPHFSVEPEIQYLHGSNKHSDILLVPNWNWDFRTSGSVVPYVTAGLGWMRSSFGQFRPTFASSEGFFQGGVGVKLYAGQRWFVAPEFRIGTELHARLGVALGYTFRK